MTRCDLYPLRPGHVLGDEELVPAAAPLVPLQTLRPGQHRVPAHGVQQIQLGQPSVNPPRLVLEVGGTSTLQAAMPVKLKTPPL